METRANNNLKFGYFLTILGAIAWGFSGICGQYLMTNIKMPPALIVNYRLLASGILLIIISLLKNKNDTFKVFKNKNDILFLLSFGIFGMLFCQYSYLNAINHTNAPTATVLQFLSSTMIVIYICFLEKRLPKIKESIAMIIALLGTFGLATHFRFDTLVISPSGLFWGVMAAISVVVYTLMPIRLMSKYPKFSIIGFGMLFGGIVLTIFLQPWKYSIPTDTLSVLALLGIILIGTVLSFSAFLIGVSYVGPVIGGLIAGLEAVSSLFFSILLLNQTFTFEDFISIVFVMSSIIILSLKKD